MALVRPESEIPDAYDAVRELRLRQYASGRGPGTDPAALRVGGRRFDPGWLHREVAGNQRISDPGAARSCQERGVRRQLEGAKITAAAGANMRCPGHGHPSRSASGRTATIATTDRFWLAAHIQALHRGPTGRLVCLTVLYARVLICTLPDPAQTPSRRPPRRDVPAPRAARGRAVLTVAGAAGLGFAAGRGSGGDGAVHCVVSVECAMSSPRGGSRLATCASTQRPSLTK